MAQTPTQQPSGWLDVKVIYARISAHNIINSSSDYLAVSCPPRDISSELEVNGARRSPSEDLQLTLRKDRADSESAEATFVSTDKLRLRRSLAFSVVHEGEHLVAGSLVYRPKSKPTALGDPHGFPAVPNYTGYQNFDNPNSDSSNGYSNSGSYNYSSSNLSPFPPSETGGQWVLECSCTTSSAWSGFVVRSVQELSDHAIQPALELCIVGNCDGAPVMLTETVQLTARRKNHWKGELDAIPETEEGERLGNAMAPLDHSQRASELRIGSDMAPFAKPPPSFASLYDHPGGYLEHGGGGGGEEGSGELTWFNAGVRVGVGLGLGMCIGVGIGVGLLVKTYQTTTRSFRRSLF
eukprot:TRINITY_DN6275_c0_g1_i1.p1 TRINITY_DN6275_c0_g1~~TRINITY_DN6275_c0_g1_i1.p1  ORF type:complete len:367 (-),score=-4.77 TRINITY_DN6275_c0_g1_i1:437-1492(-)